MSEPENEPLPDKVITTARGYTRTVHAQVVTWRCEWCGAEHTEWRYPGPAPRYCETRQLGKTLTCKQDAQNAIAAGWMRRKREAEQAAKPIRRRGPGRPRKA